MLLREELTIVETKDAENDISWAQMVIVFRALQLLCISSFISEKKLLCMCTSKQFQVNSHSPRLDNFLSFFRIKHPLEAVMRRENRNILVELKRCNKYYQYGFKYVYIYNNTSKFIIQLVLFKHVFTQSTKHTLFLLSLKKTDKTDYQYSRVYLLQWSIRAKKANSSNA